MADLYRVDAKKIKKRKWRKRIIWLIVIILFIAISIFAFIKIREMLKPNTVIKQSNATKTKVNYTDKTKRYEEANFGVDIPVGWEKAAPPGGQYKTHTWQTSEKGTNGQVITIYEDTIPANFAVNRVLIVRGENINLNIEGSASENCSQYTRGGSTTPSGVGALAKWQDIEFICDQGNKQRDVIGTSSRDGINTVILKGPLSGQHRYFFTYSNYNSANPDYTPFYETLQSFRMK